jgi:putative membrane protein
MKEKIFLKKAEPVINFFKGMVIGISNLIPGVSGGTMALVMGIYERLVEAIGKFVTSRKKRKGYFFFLLPVVLGAVSAILLLARIFSFLLSSDLFAQPTYFFFIGLILGSLPFLITVYPDMKAKPLRIFFFLIGLGLVILVVFITGKDNPVDSFKVNHTLFNIIKITDISIKYGMWLFFCGLLTSSAMVIPGVSGSAILLALGEYKNILNFLSELMVLQLIIFGIGVVAGIIGCARLIDYLIKRFPSNTYYFIIGLVIASIFQIVMQLLGYINLSLIPVIISLVSLGAGFALAYFISKIKRKTSY